MSRDGDNFGDRNSLAEFRKELASSSNEASFSTLGPLAICARAGGFSQRAASRCSGLILSGRRWRADGTAKAMNDAANLMLTRVFLTLTMRWSETQSFRRLVESGLPHAQELALRDNVEGFWRLISDPNNDAMFVDKEKFIKATGGAAGYGAAVTAQEIAKLRSSVDAASLVFMHSALDAAVSDLCRITGLVARSDWESYLKDKKVPLGEVAALGYDRLLERALDGFFQAFERESIIRRVDRLLELCKPSAGCEPVKGYKFDRKRLRDLDLLRQNIIHPKNALVPTPMTNVDESLAFLRDAGLYMAGLVNHRFDVRMDPNVLGSLLI